MNEEKHHLPTEEDTHTDNEFRETRDNAAWPASETDPGKERIALVSSVTLNVTEELVFSPENGVSVEESVAISESHVFPVLLDEEGGNPEPAMPSELEDLADDALPPEACKNDTTASLPLVAGVRLSRTGPMCFYRIDEGTLQELRDRGEHLAVGDMVMVEGDAGPVLAAVAILRRMDVSRLVSDECPGIGEVLGIAGPEDVTVAAKNTALATEARSYCQSCIRERDLDMKLVDVEVSHDRSKIAFYFTAPTRIDFRELVKDLVRKYRTRIELRQIGVRHETQMLGAVGNCGMVCCCRRYLRNFVSVAIKMAKEQNIFLNPAKISGICGRLLCCLAYEQENYDEFYRRCPKLGKKYVTTRGVMRVLRANMFKESINVLSEHNEELEFSLEEWKSLEPRRNENPPQTGGVRHQEGGQRPGREDRPREERTSEAGPRSGRSREGGPPLRQERSDRPDRTDRTNRNENRPSQERRNEFSGPRERMEPDRQSAPVAAPPIDEPEPADLLELRDAISLDLNPALQDAAPNAGHDSDSGDSSIFGLSPRKDISVQPREEDSAGSVAPSEEGERARGGKHRRPRHRH